MLMVTYNVVCIFKEISLDIIDTKPDGSSIKVYVKTTALNDANAGTYTIKYMLNDIAKTETGLTVTLFPTARDLSISPVKLSSAEFTNLVS